MVDDNSRYNEYLVSSGYDFEALCRRCGACCGAMDDPCSYLDKTGDGKYSCRFYDSRLGSRLTISGRVFECVPIRRHIASGSLRPGCGYLKALKLK